MKTQNTLFSCALAAALFVPLARATADVLLSEDFSGGDGGFTATSNGNPTLPWVFNPAGSAWSTDGEANGTPTNHFLASPANAVPSAITVRVSFEHRYSFEGNWDGGAAQISINGGAFTSVAAAKFGQSGYTNTEPLIGEHDLMGEDGFSGDSPGVGDGAFITSVFDLEGLAANDTLTVRFLAAFDQGAKGAVIPNWEINRVVVETLTDNDSDGMSNNFEEQYEFLNPDDASDAELDEEGDGLNNLEEFEQGTIPNNPDTDNDGYMDGVETGTGTWVNAANTGTNPLINDTDQDGLLDGVENPDLPYNAGDAANQPGTDPNNPNTDGDFASDASEVANGSDPTDAGDVPEILLFRYEFDTAVEGPLIDSSGQNQANLSTLSNGPDHRYGQPSLVGGDGFSIGLDAPGENHATGSFLLVPDAAHPDTFSFSLWFKPDNDGGRNPLFSRENTWWPTLGAFYLLEVDNSGGLLWRTGATETIITDPDLITDGEIHHIVVTHLDTDGPDSFEADRARIYLNGVMLAEVDEPTEVPSLESLMDGNGIYQNIWLGTHSGGPGFKGELDDFQYYSAELTPEQVLTMYEIPGSTAPFGPGAPFEVIAIAFDETSRDVTLTWNSRANKSYSVELSDAPDTFIWSELEDGLASDGETTTYVDKNVPADAGQRTYRILEQ